MAKAITKIDWETLAKQLQEALSKEMKEVERLENEIKRQNQELEHFADGTYDLVKQGRQTSSIVDYLERRLYEEMKKNEKMTEDRRHEELPF